MGVFREQFDPEDQVLSEWVQLATRGCIFFLTLDESHGAWFRDARAGRWLRGDDNEAIARAQDHEDQDREAATLEGIELSRVSPRRRLPVSGTEQRDVLLPAGPRAAGERALPRGARGAQARPGNDARASLTRRRRLAELRLPDRRCRPPVEACEPPRSRQPSPPREIASPSTTLARRQQPQQASHRGAVRVRAARPALASPSLSSAPPMSGRKSAVKNRFGPEPNGVGRQVRDELSLNQ